MAETSADADMEMEDLNHISAMLQPVEDEPVPAFALEDVPASLCAEDPVEQAEVMQHLTDNLIQDIDGGRQYHTVPVDTVRLSEFARIFKGKRTDEAINMLRKRINLVIDDDLQVDPLGDGVLWEFPEHRLDYKLVSSNCIGLSATLPRDIPSTTYQLHIQPQQGRIFRARYGYLSWSTKESMFYLGDGPYGELWLGMRPTDDDPTLEFALGGPKHSTHLKKDHWKMIYMFIAYCLSLISDLPIAAVRPYGPRRSRDMDWRTADCCNLGTLTASHPYTLNYEQTDRLDTIMREEWVDFVADAPAHWKTDEWLTTHQPYSLVYQYGQNQRILWNEGSLLREARHWEDDHDYSRIDHLTIALATHVEAYALKVDTFEPHPDEHVMRNEEVLYDSPDPHTRHEISLADYPLHDEHGRENRVYTRRGRYRARQSARPESREPCGALVDIAALAEVFYNRPARLALRTRPVHSQATGYPQAFLRRYGHLQAWGGIPFLDPVVKRLNRQLLVEVEGDDVDDEDDELEEDNEDVEEDPRPVVEAIQCQFYNQLSHRTRSSAKYHDLLHGKATSAIAGAYATDTVGKNIARKRREYCDGGLPHARFESQIKAGTPPRALRVEVNWTVRMQRLHPAHRNGRSIHRRVIRPLAEAWLNANVNDKLKAYLILLKPSVYPFLYLWMTYGLTHLIVSIWGKITERLAGGWLPPPSLVELMAVLERTLAYAHTGNAKVLSAGLMRPLWIVASLLEHGLPTLAPGIRIFADSPTSFSVPMQAWPLIGGMPASASQRTITMTYSQGFYDTFYAYLRIAAAMARPRAGPSAAMTHERRLAILIAEVAISSLLNAYQELVSEGVKAKAKELYDTGDVADEATARYTLGQLKAWQDTKHPFSYENHAYDHLLRAVVSDPALVVNGLPGIGVEATGIQAWVGYIVDMSFETDDTRPRRIGAPLFSSGSSANICRAAVKQITPFARASLHEMSLKAFVTWAFVQATNTLKVNNVPWKRPATGLQGNPSRNPSYGTWLNLGSQEPAISPSTRPTDPATIARLAQQKNDTRANWEATSIRLQNLCTVLNRTCPPEEWTLDNAGIKKNNVSTELLETTYRYIFSIFDMQRPLHHLALLIAIIMSKVAPYIDWQKCMPHNKAMNGAQVTDFVRRMPWLRSDGGRGRTNKAIMIAVTTVYILSVYEPESPVRQLLETGTALGQKWSNKHTGKTLAPIQLVRVGLARGLNLRMFKAALFKGRNKEGDWELLTPAQIDAKYQRIVSLLKDGQFGPFHAAREILGDHHAIYLAEGLGECAMPKGFNPREWLVVADQAALMGNGDFHSPDSHENDDGPPPAKKAKHSHGASGSNA